MYQIKLYFYVRKYRDRINNKDSTQKKVYILPAPAHEQVGLVRCLQQRDSSVLLPNMYHGSVS